MNAVDSAAPAVLNEVLSLNAQESFLVATPAVIPLVSSMKS